MMHRTSIKRDDRGMMHLSIAAASYPTVSNQWIDGIPGGLLNSQDRNEEG